MAKDPRSSGSAPDRPGWRSVTVRKGTAVAGTLAVHATAVLAVSLSATVGASPVLTVPPVVVTVAVVPGALALLGSRDDVAFGVRFLLYAVGLSLVMLMAVGAVLNLALPVLGIASPMTTVNLWVAMSVLVGALAAVAVLRGTDDGVRVAVPPVLRPVPLAILLLPLASILGVTLINTTGNNHLLIAVLAVIAVLPIVAVLTVDEQWYATGIWAGSLAILYHKSLWRYAGFPGSPGVVRTWEHRRWTPGISEIEPTSSQLLQNGVLFPSVARMSRVHIITELEVLNPLFVALIPVALFVAFRRYTAPQTALMGAALFAFAHPFYIQYPTAGRAATPVLFLALFGVLMSDTDRSVLERSVFGLTFVTGIVVTHYGTSYYVMFAFIGAWMLLILLDGIDDFVERLGIRRPVRADGSNTRLRRVVAREAASRKPFTLSLIAYFSIAAIAWYMYTVDGQSFESLPRHFVRNVNSLTQGQAFTGRSAARIQRDYGALSIRLSKLIYLSTGLLMAVGFVYAYYQRFYNRDCSFDDRYLAVASYLLATFGVTILYRNWGGGRPMMITFSFTAVFAVLGLLVILRTEYPRWLRNRLPAVGLLSGERPAAVFGVVLLVLFLLNTGVVSAVAFDRDRPPSIVPIQQDIATSDSPELRSKTFRETDVATHVWLIDHYGGTQEVYGDRIAGGQTDWYIPAIELGANRPTYHLSDMPKPRGELLAQLKNGTAEGYVMVLGHNQALDIVLAQFTTERRPLSSYRSEFRERNRIYTTGKSSIYVS